LLKTENLTHTYSAGTPFEHAAISGIDFKLKKGECVGIIGATGSGKSTFIQHLNGLLKPTAGKVFYNDRDINSSKSFARETRFKVGLVFQYPEYQLFETTVFDDIAFGPKNMGLAGADVKERVLEAAGFAGLGESFLQKSPFELSGGEKRRVAIAGVIAMRPEVLILDEPTAGLDPRGRDEIIKNILDYKKAHDASVIMVTHDMEEIARSAHRIVIFERGKIALEGTPSQVFSEASVLSELGLTAPKVTLVACKLRELGLPISKNIYNASQLQDEIKALRTEGSYA